MSNRDLKSSDIVHLCQFHSSTFIWIGEKLSAALFIQLDHPVQQLRNGKQEKEQLKSSTHKLNKNVILHSLMCEIAPFALGRFSHNFQ